MFIYVKLGKQTVVNNFTDSARVKLPNLLTYFSKAATMSLQLNVESTVFSSNSSFYGLGNLGSRALGFSS